MNRRDAIRMITVSATAVTVASPALVTAAVVAKPKPRPLPAISSGTVLTEKAWNDAVNRINELSNGGTL